MTQVMILMMTSAQVVETSVNVTTNSPSQDYTHPDDHNLPTCDLMLNNLISNKRVWNNCYNKFSTSVTAARYFCHIFGKIFSLERCHN